jgi:hypothetical protein
MVALPLPITVAKRESTTFCHSAGIIGWPGKSLRRNRIFDFAAAGAIRIKTGTPA